MQELFLNSLRAHIDDLGIHVNRENASTATREFPGALTKKEAAPDWEIPQFDELAAQEGFAKVNFSECSCISLCADQETTVRSTKLEGIGVVDVVRRKNAATIWGLTTSSSFFSREGNFRYMGRLYKGTCATQATGSRSAKLRHLYGCKAFLCYCHLCLFCVLRSPLGKHTERTHSVTRHAGFVDGSESTLLSVVSRFPGVAEKEMFFTILSHQAM